MKIIIAYIFTLVITMNLIYADGSTVTVFQPSSNIIYEGNNLQFYNISLTGTLIQGAKYCFKIKISGEAVDRGRVYIDNDTLLFDLTEADNNLALHRVFRIYINGDTQYSPSSSFNIEVYTPNNGEFQFAGIINADQTRTVLDNETIRLQLADQSWIEQPVDTVKKITVPTQGGISPKIDIKCKYKILSSSTATFGTDYIIDNEEAVIYLKAGSNNLSLPNITIKSDSVNESEEYINILVTSENSDIQFNNSNIIQIKIKEWRKPYVEFNPFVEITEGQVKQVILKLEHSNDTESSSVDIQISHGSTLPTNNSDITPIDPLTLTFIAGQTIQSFNIEAIDDSLTEGSENFNIKIVSSSSNIAINPDKDTLNVTLIDNDTKTKAKIKDNFKSITEGNRVCMTVITDQPRSYDYFISYKITFTKTPSANRSDFKDSDILRDRMRINSNSVENYICFNTNDDNIIEDDEFFRFSIYIEGDNPDVEIPSTFKSSVEVRINNNDTNSTGGKEDISGTGRSGPTLINGSNYPITFVESSTTKEILVKFHLNKPPPVSGYSLNYVLINDSAISGKDYIDKSGNCLFR